jgi:hypothetical protein
MCLLKYLKSDEGKKAEVAINANMPRTENLTIVGNWFLALTVAAAPGRGYYQTIFTRHAPSLQAKIAEFDEEFLRILSEQNVTLADSRRHAMKEIEKILAQLSSTRRP